MTRKISFNKVKDEAEKLGATAELCREGDSWVCRVEAPFGYKWHEGDVHEIVAYAYAPWKPDYNDTLERMEFGMYECDDRPCCDWCDDLGTDD